MSATVNFSWGALDSSYCFSSLNAFKNDIFNLLEGSVDVNGIVIGPNTPAVGDQDKAWIKTDGSGRPIGIFLFLGSWIWPNPRGPSSQERMIWAGTEADLWAYDGGDGSDPSGVAPTLTTGAMWQADHTFDFKIPMGAGTSGTTYDGNPATVLAQGGSAGAERVELSDTEIAHRHVTGRFDTGSNAGRTWFMIDNAVTTLSGLTAQDNPGAGGATPGTEQSGDIADAGGNWAVSSEVQIGNTPRTAHQNLPPVVGVFFARRTSRKFYSA